MKKYIILWAALSMTAALVMTSCSKDDNITVTPQDSSTSIIIPYTVNVNGGATTLATVDSDNKTLKFAAGDKLYVTGTNIKGVLEIQSGTGTASATFSGDLTYSGEGTPAADLALTATLVSAQQTDGTEVTINPTTGAVTVNYPTTAYCTDVATAVQKYSNLTGTSTYSAKKFTLTQQTAFLNFEITFEGGAKTATTLSAVVNNNGSDICTANVTTTTESEMVVAKFVLPVAKGTTLSSAKVTMGSVTATSFGASQTLEGKVYNVKRAPYIMAAKAISEDEGKLICTAGHIHMYNYNANPACTATRVAKIIYVGSETDNTTYTHGLALALTDEGEMDWESAKTACSNKNTSAAKVTNASWMLPSEDQWTRMIEVAGYTALRDGFSIVGGTNIPSDEYAYYLSSTEVDSEEANAFFFRDGHWQGVEKVDDYPFRACLVF
ncbi:MAG: hypothetical protein J6Y40_02790 [Bacteroidales bacterium]|nr:hypothetical protein [Bacteroidales bacterium]